MASSMISTASVASVNRASPAQASMVAPFTGLKSSSAFPVTRKESDITSFASNGGRVQCRLVWPTVARRSSRLSPTFLTYPQSNWPRKLTYLLRQGWIPCLEFELEHGFVWREHHRGPGYYDGRYWTMWKLPMFGCTDSSQVMKELDEAKKAHPNAFIRIIGFDNVRQVQCINFIAHKPSGYKISRA